LFDLRQEEHTRFRCVAAQVEEKASRTKREEQVMAKAKRKQHHLAQHAASRHHSRSTSAGTQQSGRMQKNAKSGFETFDILSGPMARIMGQNWSLFQKTVQAMQEESLHFFNRRLEHTSQIMENSRDLPGVSGLMQLQQEWMLDLARDYSEQATRFADLIRHLAVDSTERLVEASSEVLERSESELEEHRAAA
jgi:hypothetical protein